MRLFFFLKKWKYIYCVMTVYVCILLYLDTPLSLLPFLTYIFIYTHHSLYNVFFVSHLLLLHTHTFIYPHNPPPFSPLLLPSPSSFTFSLFSFLLLCSYLSLSFFIFFSLSLYMRYVILKKYYSWFIPIKPLSHTRSPTQISLLFLPSLLLPPPLPSFLFLLFSLSLCLPPFLLSLSSFFLMISLYSIYVLRNI